MSNKKITFWELRKYIIIVLLIGAVIFSFISCAKMVETDETAENLPQITNKSQLQEALSGSKKLYAVLKAPVKGSVVEDEFDILNDEYFYIQYSGETLESSVHYEDVLGAQTTYRWEKNNDIRTKMSDETYLYDDIPVDFTGCSVDNPDALTSDSQIKENAKSKVAVNINYYYPEGLPKDPDADEENYGIKRYDIRFLKSGTNLSFIAWIGDNEINVYSTSTGDESDVFPVLVQNGELSDLSYYMSYDDVSSVMLLWIGVLFIILVLIFIPEKDSEETVKGQNKKKENKNKKKHK